MPKNIDEIIGTSDTRTRRQESIRRSIRRPIRRPSIQHRRLSIQRRRPSIQHRRSSRPLQVNPSRSFNKTSRRSRSRPMPNDSVDEISITSTQLSSIIKELLTTDSNEFAKKLNQILEKYPNLKDDADFLTIINMLENQQRIIKYDFDNKNIDSKDVIIKKIESDTDLEKMKLRIKLPVLFGMASTAVIYGLLQHKKNYIIELFRQSINFTSQCKIPGYIYGDTDVNSIYCDYLGPFLNGTIGNIAGIGATMSDVSGELLIATLTVITLFISFGVMKMLSASEFSLGFFKAKFDGKRRKSKRNSKRKSKRRSSKRKSKF